MASKKSEILKEKKQMPQIDDINIRQLEEDSDLNDNFNITARKNESRCSCFGSDDNYYGCVF